MTSEPIRLSPVQAARKHALWVLALFLLAGMALVATPAGESHEIVEWSGRIALFACLIGRCWCSLYIGGRKISELVRVGPYSIVRNPLYFFSFVGAFGVGAQTGSLIVAVLFVAVTWAVFRLVVRKEEQLLLSIYGADYADYLTTTPRFLPNPRLWRGEEWVRVRPGLVVRTFVDGLWFLAAIPIAGLFEMLQNAGVLPVLLTLV